MNYIGGLKSCSASESLGEHRKNRFLGLTPRDYNSGTRTLELAILKSSLNDFQVQHPLVQASSFYLPVL